VEPDPDPFGSTIICLSGAVSRSKNYYENNLSLYQLILHFKNIFILLLSSDFYNSVLLKMSFSNGKGTSREKKKAGAYKLENTLSPWRRGYQPMSLEGKNMIRRKRKKRKM
jgi:hypothetical protein